MRSTIFVLTVLIAACSSPTSDSDADAGAASAPTLASETTSSSTTAAATETPPTLAAAEEEIDTGFGAIAGFWDASVDENGRRDIIYELTVTSVLSEVSRTMPRLQGLDRTVPLCDGS